LYGLRFFFIFAFELNQNEMAALYKIFTVLTIMLLIACGGSSDNEKVSTHHVHNPQTANGTSDLSNLPVISFVKEEHDFGQLIQGERVSFAFKFTNNGAADLVIAAANAGCGCTVPNYPRHPIKPGDTGVIEVAFNTSGRSGFQNQRVSIVANTQPNTTVLTIKANVVLP